VAADRPQLGGDGLHLNPTGYQKMTDTVDITLLTK